MFLLYQDGRPLQRVWLRGGGGGGGGEGEKVNYKFVAELNINIYLILTGKSRRNGKSLRR